ncbi:6-phosphogluconate dehydrogenase [Streptomyces viridochromogenes]|uniref:6-phosphogluconate dehydrogenase n=1 Tax=Streptomyces viridochromogenes TaxID=1938 RepID=A0A0J7ZIT2_STRVR|nr:NAD(P)-dependent oxidoreductase [Streptomyces viridochromogenes]KMS75946.1 6-phosphogluconate dehydrogenase [Streptomyces viridochromogenes]
MSRAPARVGFIGLGSQGAPMARRIVGAGHETTLWARRRTTLAPFADSGARTAGSPAELATASDLVCLCVVDDADVEQVVTGPDGVLAGLRRGGVIVVHSTVHPDTCRRLEALARTSGVSVLDAPVSGGGRAAEQGTLVVMAGGDPQVFAFCRPVFDTYGDPVVHLGPTGSGQIAKILNNLLFTAHLGLAADALGLGGTLGLDRTALGRVLPRGSAASFALDRVSDAGGGLDRIAAHAGGLLAKDVRLFGEIADRAGVRDAAALRNAALSALAAMGR